MEGIATLGFSINLLKCQNGSLSYMIIADSLSMAVFFHSANRTSDFVIEANTIKRLASKRAYFKRIVKQKEGLIKWIGPLN